MGLRKTYKIKGTSHIQMGKKYAKKNMQKIPSTGRTFSVHSFPSGVLVSDELSSTCRTSRRRRGLCDRWRGWEAVRELELEL